MKQFKILLGMLFVFGVLLSACQTATETPPAGEKFSFGQNAAIESIDIFLMESFPLQAQAVISGYLPDGCTELDEITVERDGQDFILTVETRRPTGDIACTQALVPFEEKVDLDISGLEAGTYTVIAQEQETTFTLDVDNVLPQDASNTEYKFGSDATVENLQVSLMESFPVQVSVTLTGYLPDGCTEIQEITAVRENQNFTISIVTRRPAGDVACTMAILPFEETISLDVAGLPAGEYTVSYGELSDSFVLQVDN